MLAAAFAGTLFHALISFSVVCHINPLLCSLIELSGRDGRPPPGLFQPSCQAKASPNAKLKPLDCDAPPAFKRYTGHLKAEQKKTGGRPQEADSRRQTAGERSTRVEWFCRMCVIWGQ